MNLKDKLIRRLLDFGKKHRLMVYPTLALVAVISAVSHAICWGKGNGKRVVASVSVVALLITQSLFLTSSAADEELPVVPADVTILQEDVGDYNEDGSTVPEVDDVADVIDIPEEINLENDDSAIDQDNNEVDEIAAEENSVDNNLADEDGLMYAMTLGAIEDTLSSINVVYYRVDENGVATELSYRDTVEIGEDGFFNIGMPGDNKKAGMAFGSESESSNFVFSSCYSDITCQTALADTVTFDAFDELIQDGTYEVYFKATRKQYPVVISDGENVIANLLVETPGAAEGDINPSVTYTVQSAGDYNAYKTGYKFTGVNYSGNFYTSGSDITLAPEAYVSAVAMDAAWEAYKLSVTYDGATDEDIAAGIVDVTVSDVKTVEYTYGEALILPDSHFMDGQVDSEAYYIDKWIINGVEYDPGDDTLNTSDLFDALDVTADPNISPRTVTAKWVYKEITLESASDIIAADANGAVISTHYGDTFQAKLNAVYKDDTSGTQFSYEISDADNQKLSQYHIQYSLNADSSINTGITFSTDGYVSDVTTDKSEAVTITLRVTDMNKPAEEQQTYEFPVTLVSNPREITIDASSVMSSNGMSAPTKPYDGLTGIDVKTTADLQGVLDGDTVSVQFAASAILDSADAGTGKDVTLSSVELTGADSTKYVIAGVTGPDATGVLTLEGIGTVEKRSIGIVMELAEGESDTVRFGEANPDYILRLTDDSIAKLSTADQANYAAMDSTEFVRQYLGFSGWSTARTEYSKPKTYSISPVIDSTGKNYTVDASGLNKQFTVTRDDGSDAYTFDSEPVNGYYKGLNIIPAGGYTKIRRVSSPSDDIPEGSNPASVKANSAWKNSIEIEDMVDGTIYFQMMSASGAITQIVTRDHISVDTSGPVLKSVKVSPVSDIKDYIREYGFGSYYHSQNGIESITITLTYESTESPCTYLHYYFVDDKGNASGETVVSFREIGNVNTYEATVSIGTAQRGQLIVYAENKATNVSEKNKIKLDSFTKYSSTDSYYEWMVENNIDGADIVVSDADGSTAIVSTVNNSIWYNALNLSVDASDSESGVNSIVWNIQTPSGTITPSPTENAGDNLASVVSKANGYAKIYEYIFGYKIAGEDMPAGAYTVTATLEDNAGNSVDLEAVGPYNVDCRKPVIDVDAIADSDVYQSGVELGFDVSEGTGESGIQSVELYKVESSENVLVKKWIPADDAEKYAISCSYKVVNNGTYRIVATDIAGNQSTTDRTFNKLSTTVPDEPEISIDGINGNNGWIMGMDIPTATITCQNLTTDGVKVTTYYKVISTGSTNQATIDSGDTEYTFDITAQGEVTIEAWSVSEAGLESSKASRMVQIDTVAPTIEITEATVGTDGKMYINFRAKDNVSGVDSDRVLLNGEPIDVTEETGAVTGSFLAEGTKTYSVTVQDNAGNTSDTLNFTPLALYVDPVTEITSDGAYLEADIVAGTYDVDDYYIAIKKHSDTSYKTALFNDSRVGNTIQLDCTFRGLSPDTVYDYKVYASNSKSEIKTCEGSFRTTSVRATGSVYGSVTYADNITHKDYPVFVTLYEANTVVASTRLDSIEDTGYLFTNLKDGAYRVVATNGVLTETAAVTIQNGGIIYPTDYAVQGGVNLVLNGYNTSVVIEDNAINITADGLETLYDNSVYKGILTNEDIAVLEAGGKIDISLHAGYIDVSDISSEEMSVFDAKLNKNAVIERYINLYVLKEVWNADGQYVNGTPVRIPELYESITISFPLDDLAGQKIYVASVHNEGSNYSFINWADDVTISNNYVTISTRYFSVYALYRVIPSEKTYKVTWKDGDGNTMKVETVKEGESATPPSKVPTKKETEKYTYVFTGWDSDYSSITQDMIISARFKANIKVQPDPSTEDPTTEDPLTEDPGTTEDPDGPTTENPGTTENTNPGKTPNSYTYLGSSVSPNTGDATPVILIIAVMCLAAVGIVTFGKKIKNNK